MAEHLEKQICLNSVQIQNGRKVLLCWGWIGWIGFQSLIAFFGVWDTLSYLILYNSFIFYVPRPQYELILPGIYDV